jgi:sulfur carrier protein ThiS
LKKHRHINDNKVVREVSVHVKLSDFLARKAPLAEFEIKTNAGITVEAFIAVLSKRFGEEFCNALVDHAGRLHAGLAVVLNRQFIPPHQMTRHTIRESSDLSVMPIAGGG